MSNLKSHLFETNAVKVCNSDNPFWLTSGKISAYFINTQFLYGSEEEANQLLEFINENLNNKLAIPKAVFEKTLKQYENNAIYKNTIDEMISFIKNNININEIDYIAGGERRDWFFSLIIANMLKKPHLTLFKDLGAVTSDYNFENTSFVNTINGKKILHITDLITAATNFIRYWIPIIQNIGGELLWALSVVDRKQGGTERLKDLGINTYSLTAVDETLFIDAFNNGIIDKNQLDLVHRFISDPDGSMREFLISHPDFIENALKSNNERTVARARLLVDGNLYNL